MHDKNGTKLDVGDIVVIRARISEIYACEDYCNAQLKIGYEKEHGPDNVTNTITINTRQTLLVDKG